MKLVTAASLFTIALSGAAMVRAQTTVPPLDGAKLFAQYCASCHGTRGTGDGPMSAALKTKAADLTLIARRNGGVFPLDKVQALIAGDKLTGLSHGTREMPVWGPIFSQDISDRDYGKLRVYNVAKYLEGLQRQ